MVNMHVSLLVVNFHFGECDLFNGQLQLDTLSRESKTQQFSAYSHIPSVHQIQSKFIVLPFSMHK